MNHALTDPDLRALLADTLAGAPAAEGAVICLCADWCGTCREFQPAFTAAAATHAGLAFRWLDIEDEADALGDVDVETFPTLVIGGRDGVLRFAGPVLPQAAQITRLLQSVMA
ncbi:MAG: thioredoxin family protein [Pseudomonadota bacterium]|nr:thioredoxin family protein [Pseudomonadota bacterium]